MNGGPESGDAAAREAAADPAQSVLLQAPAGSGKTAVLAERFLRLLCTVAQPEEILAITFTLKAAAEMRERVLSALQGELREEDPTAPRLRVLAGQVLQRAAQRGWSLLEDPSALRIQTIDSFNFWLASQLPVAARAGGPLTVTETPQGLYVFAARMTLGAAQESEELAADLDLLFERLDNNWRQVERMLAEMLAERSHWLRHVLGCPPGALCERIQDSLERFIGDHLERLSAVLSGDLRAAVESLPTVGPLGRTAPNLPAWQALAALALTLKGDWRRRVNAAVDAAYGDRAAARSANDCVARLSRIEGLDTLLHEVRGLPSARLAAQDARALAALARVLQRAAAELQLQFARAGRVDYVYVAAAAQQALTDAGEPTDLALRTGLSLRHILVDEFQDTSITQSHLLATLTAAWEPGDGRTLFVVGDPMQSIYRFREAEVGLFVAAREHGIGALPLLPLQLVRNFRSRPSLVHWSNRVFPRAFPQHDDLRAGAVAFSASEPARAAASGAAVTLRLFPDEAAEAAAVAGSILELRRADPEARIAVLIAARSHAAPIVAELDRLRIESLGVDLVPLAHRPVVCDLVHLLRALDDRADRAAWLAVLRAPWCGASLAALTVLSQPDDPLLVCEALTDAPRLARCPESDRARLQRVSAVLAAACARKDQVPVADWLENTWMRLGGPDVCTAQALQDARALFTALAQGAASGAWHDPRDLEPLLERLFSQSGVGGDNPVQIMTIHAAKGLQFAHVFVPSLARRGRGDEPALLRLIDLPPDVLLIAPVAQVGEESEAPLSRLIARLQGVRARHERARLMYVAATRARETLHLSAAPRPRRDGTIRPPPDTLLHVLWPVLQAEFVSATAPPAAAPAGPAQHTLQRLSLEWSAPRLAASPQLPRLPLADRPGMGADTLPEFSWAGETQRQVGTLVHMLLAQAAQEITAGTEPAAPDVQEVSERLRHQGVAPQERAAAAALVVAALAGTLADERGRWILSAAHAQASCELPLTGVSQGRLRNIIIDRSFVDASGTRWVIDYKTSRHTGGGMEEFLANELARYREQLLTYVQLAGALGPEPVRAGLYFPLLRQFRELSL